MKSKKSKTSSVFLLLLVAISGMVWWQRQYIYDQWQLAQYNPPAEIIRYADETTMTDTARRSFYVNKPSLKDRTNFSQFCTNATEETVVLGCYLSPQQGIYLLNVDNSELEGIEQVTAAHEMLHAQYDRLNRNERARVDGLLQAFYDKQLPDGTIKETIDGYRTTEPDSVINEMHSILGSQYAILPQELETYYKQYFTNRRAVVDFYERYEQAFSSRQAQIETYDKDLKSTKRAIDSLQADVDRQSADLDARRQRLNAARENDNVQDYNTGVAGYNAAVNAYNADLGKLKDVIKNYNSLVEARNAIAFEEQELVQALSTPAQTKR